MISNRIAVVLCATLLVSCNGREKAPDTTTAATTASSRAGDATPRAEAEQNRAAVFMADAAEIPLLAIEVEVTADDVRVVGSEVIRGPRPANAAVPDLTVNAASERGDFRYSIADPRLAEVDGEGSRVLPSARTFIYIPLSYDVARVAVQRVDGARRSASRGAALDPRNLMAEACGRDATNAPAACRQVLQARAAAAR